MELSQEAGTARGAATLFAERQGSDSVKSGGRGCRRRTSWLRASHSLGCRLAQSSSKRLAARRGGVCPGGTPPAPPVVSKAPLLLARVQGRTPGSRACRPTVPARCCAPRAGGWGVRLAVVTCVSAALLGGVAAFSSALYTARAGALSGARGDEAIGWASQVVKLGTMGHERASASGAECANVSRRSPSPQRVWLVDGGCPWRRTRC